MTTPHEELAAEISAALAEQFSPEDLAAALEELATDALPDKRPGR